MQNLIQLKGIKTEEFLYHMFRGFKIVNKILKDKYPNQPQLKEVKFTFTIDKEEQKTIGGGFFLTFKKVKTEKYVKSDIVTFDLSSISEYYYKPKQFDWKETNFSIQFDLAGSILRRIAPFIRTTINNPKMSKLYSFKDTFIMTQSTEGLLKLSLKKDVSFIEGGIISKDVVTHEMEVTLETNKQKGNNPEVIAKN